MSNTFLPTSFTATTTFASLTSFLTDAGFPNQSSASITSQDGYIRNESTSVNLYVGFGDSAPTSYEIISPLSAVEFTAGLNTNNVWLRSASSTVVVGFCEGAAGYRPPNISGVIGSTTLTAGQVPAGDGSGNLITSSITDDGLGAVTIASDVTTTGTITSDDATTPGFTVESGNTNTGFIDIKGKTSGKIRITTADATAQTINITAAAQTSGAGTITIPDLAGASTAPVFTGLAQTLVTKTLTSPVINTGTIGTSLVPTTDDGATLGDTTHNFSDLFLASGAVLNYANGNVAVTHTSGILTMGTGDFRVTTAGTNTASVVTVGGTQTLTAKTLTSPVIATGLTASGSASNDFSASTGTFKTSSGANTLSGATTALNLITTVAGTTSLANVNTPAGTLKTTAAAGDHEFDGAASYITNEATAGRGAVAVDQYFRLTSAGSTISTIANFFGANSNPVLVSGGYYEIDIYAHFLKSTAGTVVWTFTNSAAPTAQDIYYEMSPVAGIVAPPGTATMLIGQIYNDATAALALAATGALTDAVQHFMHTKIWLQNSTGTSLQIQATVSAGTITPGIGSRWYCRRLPAANAGLFAA